MLSSASSPLSLPLLSCHLGWENDLIPWFPLGNFVESSSSLRTLLLGGTACQTSPLHSFVCTRVRSLQLSSKGANTDLGLR